MTTDREEVELALTVDEAMFIFVLNEICCLRGGQISELVAARMEIAAGVCGVFPQRDVRALGMSAGEGVVHCASPELLAAAVEVLDDPALAHGLAKLNRAFHEELVCIESDARRAGRLVKNGAAEVFEQDLCGGILEGLALAELPENLVPRLRWYLETRPEPLWH